MKYNLFLDDVREPRSAFYYTSNDIYNKLDWIIVRNFNEFINFIKINGLPNVVSFDHDLCDEHYNLFDDTNVLFWEEYYFQNDREMTGYDCAKWLCDYCLNNNLKFPKYLIHSANVVGSLNIKNYIENFLKYNSNLK